MTLIKYKLKSDDEFRYHPNWWYIVRILLCLVAITVVLTSFTSCSSKHIQKSHIKTDSVVVHKVDSSKTKTKSVNRTVHKASAKVIKDLTKKREVVKEKTVIVFSDGMGDDAGGVYQSPTNTLNYTYDGRNGTAEDYLPTRKIKSITHTKTTTKTIDNNITDSSESISDKKQQIDLSDISKHIIQDSSEVKKEVSTTDKKVFRWSWWWLLLLLIPATAYYFRNKLKSLI